MLSDASAVVLATGLFPQSLAVFKRSSISSAHQFLFFGMHIEIHDLLSFVSGCHSIALAANHGSGRHVTCAATPDLLAAVSAQGVSGHCHDETSAKARSTFGSSIYCPLTLLKLQASSQSLQVYTKLLLCD